MDSFDMRTVIFSFLLTYVVSTFVITILWAQYHNRYKGTNYLILNFVFQTVGLFLIILRNTIPEWISVDLANTLVIAGLILGYIGLEAHTGKKTNQIHNYILLLIFASVHTWFTYIKPDLTIRNFNISATSLIIFFQCAWLLLYRISRKDIRLTHSVGLVYVAFSIVCILNNVNPRK